MTAPTKGETEALAQQKYNDAGKIDVRHDDEVEGTKLAQFGQVDLRLFVVHLRSLFQVLDRPHDGKQDRHAAGDVDQVEDVPPVKPREGTRRNFILDDECDI